MSDWRLMEEPEIVYVQKRELERLRRIEAAARRLAQEGWTNPEYPHPGLLEDGLIEALEEPR